MARHVVFDHVSGTLSELDRRVVAAVPPGGNWRNLPEDFPSQRVQQIRHAAKRGGGSRSTYYGRLRWDRPAYTISTYISRPGNGCFIHPAADRLITLREAARLQSFPDAYRFSGSPRARAAQIGNAVPPLLAYHLAGMHEPGIAVDLFAGAGGLSLGLDWAGHQVVAAVDNDPNANATMERNWPGADNVMEADLSDHRAFERTMRLVKRRSRGDGLMILAGGPPCQGFSTAGHCRIGDERNRMVFVYLAAVERLQPRVVIMENVPALLWRGKTILNEVVGRLGVLGYVTSMAIVHAEAYGVPQLRRRLVLQGVLDGEPRWPAPSHLLAEPAFPSSQPGASTGTKPVRCVAEAISDLSASAELDPDTPIAAGRPASDYQRCMRGQLPMSDIAGQPTRWKVGRDSDSDTAA